MRGALPKIMERNERVREREIFGFEELEALKAFKAKKFNACCKFFLQQSRSSVGERNRQIRCLLKFCLSMEKKYLN